MAADGNPIQTDPSAQTIDQQIARTENLDELHRIVTAAVIQQLASFLALDPDDIQVGAAVADVGLDSLLAIEFTNWVVRSMQAPIQTSEILDAPSLSHLVQLVVQRSKLCQNAVSKVSNGVKQGDQAEDKAMSTGHPSTTLNPPAASTTPPILDVVSTTFEKLPALPVPELKDLIKRHLSYLRAFATEEEYQNTLNLARDFQSPDGMGKRLYDRLQAIKTANPETWYHDLYLRNQYLVRNGSLAPYMSFFFTHPPSRIQHSQATRAAIVASTVIRYMFRLRRGLLKPRYVNEQPLSMELYRYLFNTCREPRVGVDVMGQYPGNNYFVVLRRGHVYRVEFEERPDGVQSEALEAVFEGILEDSPTEVDWLGMLTADDRISWAKVCTWSMVNPNIRRWS
jgi:aryl carrier-like protein